MLAECVADVSDDERRWSADSVRLGRPLGRPSPPLLFSHQGSSGFSDLPFEPLP